MQIRSGSGQKSESKTNFSQQEAPSPFNDFRAVTSPCHRYPAVTLITLVMGPGAHKVKEGRRMIDDHLAVVGPLQWGGGVGKK